MFTNPLIQCMEALIKTLSLKMEIKCKKCGYEGETTIKREYYIDCPKCEELVYVGHLTKN